MQIVMEVLYSIIFLCVCVSSVVVLLSLRWPESATPPVAHNPQSNSNTLHILFKPLHLYFKHPPPLFRTHSTFNSNTLHILFKTLQLYLKHTPPLFRAHSTFFSNHTTFISYTPQQRILKQRYWSEIKVDWFENNVEWF